MGLRDQTGDKDAEHSLAPAAGVVDELEKAEIVLWCHKLAGMG